MEYAFGLDSLEIDVGGIFLSEEGGVSRGLPIVRFTIEGEGNQVIFARRSDFGEVNLTYSVEYSNDLQSWTASQASPNVLYNDAEIDVVGVTDPLFLQENSKYEFYRVRVELGN